MSSCSYRRCSYIPKAGPKSGSICTRHAEGQHGPSHCSSIRQCEIRISVPTKTSHTSGGTARLYQHTRKRKGSEGGRGRRRAIALRFIVRRGGVGLAVGRVRGRELDVIQSHVGPRIGKGIAGAAGALVGREDFPRFDRRWKLHRVMPPWILADRAG